MSITRRVGSFGKIATLWVAMVVAILCVCLGALVFFNAALLVWLSHYVGLAEALVFAGLILLVEAVVLLMGFQLALKRMKAKQSSGLADVLGLTSMALRFATLTFQRSPRKALIAAVIFGALADYFTSNRDKKS